MLPYLGASFYPNFVLDYLIFYSMWPLLKRDGLVLPYLAMLLLWNRLVGYNPLRYQANLFVRCIPLVRPVSSLFYRVERLLTHITGNLYCVYRIARLRSHCSTAFPSS